MPAFISISSGGLCGEDDFRRLELKKARLPARMAGVLQVEKY